MKKLKFNTKFLLTTVEKKTSNTRLKGLSRRDKTYNTFSQF
jgi:hypothetical protein